MTGGYCCVAILGKLGADGVVICSGGFCLMGSFTGASEKIFDKLYCGKLLCKACGQGCCWCTISWNLLFFLQIGQIVGKILTGYFNLFMMWNATIWGKRTYTWLPSIIIFRNLVTILEKHTRNTSGISFSCQEHISNCPIFFVGKSSLGLGTWVVHLTVSKEAVYLISYLFMDSQGW